MPCNLSELILAAVFPVSHALDSHIAKASVENSRAKSLIPIDTQTNDSASIDLPPYSVHKKSREKRGNEDEQKKKKILYKASRKTLTTYPSHDSTWFPPLAKGRERVYV